MNPAWELYVGRYRILVWRWITFGWHPLIARNVYGGKSTVLTWWRLWIEWTP